ncbi:MAG TPA: hypothetical protein VEI97_19990 [bacterium]|nr:hypothetical protein [bacterium]
MASPPPPQTLEAGAPNSTWHLLRWTWAQAPWGPLVVLVAHLTLLVAVVALFFPQSGGQDLYWYLATGKVQDSPGAVQLAEPKPASGPWIPGPSIDPLAWTTPKDPGDPGFQPWINHEWLFTLAIYGAYDAAGIEGLVGFKYLLLGYWGLALIWMTWRLARDWYLGLLTAAVTLPMVAAHTDLRPQLVTYTLVTLLLGTWYRAPGRPWLAVLIWATLLAFWANVHGAVVFGVVLLSALLLIHRFQGTLPWSVVGAGLAATILAPLVNPYGIEVYRYALGWLQNPELKFAIQEWRPVTFGGLSGPSEWIWLLFGVVALGAPLLTGTFGRLRWEPQGWLMWGIWLMPLLAVRHIPLADIALTAWWFQEIARALPWLELRRPKAADAHATVADPAPEAPAKVRPGPRLGAEAAAVLAVLLVIPTPRLLQPFDAVPKVPVAHLHPPYAFPSGAVAFLETHRLGGNVFNYYDWGGYLGWRFLDHPVRGPGDAPPPSYTFIDGRLDTVFPYEVIHGYGNFTSIQPTALPNRSAWKTWEPQIDFVIFPGSIAGQPPDVIAQWQAQPDWALVYRDALSVVLARRSNLPPGFVEAAQGLLLPVPNDPQSHHGRGLMALDMGDLQGAIREFEQALVLDPSYAAAYEGMALALDVSGEKARAQQHFREAEKWGY